MDLRQLLNRPEKPKSKLQLLLAKSVDRVKSGYCIVLMLGENQQLLHNTDEISYMRMYQCYSPDWLGHGGFGNKINNVFCKLYDTPSNKFWNIYGKYLTAVKPEEFPYKQFLEYKDIMKEISDEVTEDE